MKTSECAKTVGLSIDTLRFYEKKGLIKPGKRGYSRDYTNDDIEILEAIKILKSTGMTLDNIKLIVDMETTNVDFHLLKDLLESQLEQIKEQVVKLKRSKLILEKSLSKVLGKL